MLNSSSQVNQSCVNLVMSSFPSKSTNICQYFDRGRNCRFGKRCKFLHIINIDRSEDTQQCSFKQDKASEENCELVSTVENLDIKCKQNEAVKKESIADSSLPACRFYSTTGRCNYGANCQFAHQKSKKDSLGQTSELCHDGGINEIVHDDKDEVTAVNADHPCDTKITPVEDDEICQYFLRTGWCRFGRRCRYIHKKKTAKTAAPSKSIVKAVPNNDDKETNNVAGRKDDIELDCTDTKLHVVKQKVCRYFKFGHCNSGKRCKFLHVNDSEITHLKLEKSEDKNISDDHKTKPVSRAVNPNPTVFDIETVSDETFSDLRIKEITQFKKRYPKAEENIAENGDVLLQILFHPSDPDWPYDVKFVPLCIKFCRGYPRAVLQVDVVDSENLPTTLQRYIQKCIADWIDKRYDTFADQGKVEVVTKAFLKWLDRALEDIFTTGLKQYQKELIAKAAGLTFVPASELQEEYRQRQSGTDEEDANAGEEEDECDDDYDSEESDSEDDEEENVMGQVMGDENQRGTEVKLYNLEFKNSLATLMATKVQVIIQCDRCKNQTEVTTPVNRPNAAACSKCSATQLLTFRPSLVHENSCILGYVDVEACTVFDVILPECEFMAGCFTCNKEMVLKGFATGHPKETWCNFCNAKMKVCVESMRFLRLRPQAPVIAGQVHKIETTKVKKVPKDPAIQLGSPLPADGTCKHYKKSYRWFRFPCCGKAYPCDICHEEKESHEMKLANRMICGHCCKEQPYAVDKPCVACNNSMTKKATAHWEGGKGCRDKIKMSRDDEKKYSNCNKTISRKQQEKKVGGKKNTKVRHT